MDQYERQEKKREAMRTLRAQRRRAGELRRRVVATSLVAFVLLWAVVFAQMATGNDPVLSRSSKAVATTPGHRQKARAAKVKTRRSEATTTAAEEVEAEPTETATGAEASEGEAAEAEGEANEAEAIQAEAEAAEVEAAEIAEAEAAEAEAEAAVEEPAPVTTSQS
jgi:cytoskeletal protein RodZ